MCKIGSVVEKKFLFTTVDITYSLIHVSKGHKKFNPVRLLSSENISFRLERPLHRMHTDRLKKYVVLH